jgi:peptidoglycan LD-endopeptidase LytH
VLAAIAGAAAMHVYHLAVGWLHTRGAGAAPAAARVPLPAPAPGASPAAPSLPVDPSLGPVPAVSSSDLEWLRGRRLTLPVAGIPPDALVDTYMQTRGGERIHEALDILAPRGTAVLAVDDGRIVKLFKSDRGGLTIYQFDPTETYAYYYAHLGRYAPGLKEGHIAAKGEVLGEVGSTGNASVDAPHLHFTIFKLHPEKRWWEGTPLNPFPLWSSP